MTSMICLVAALTSGDNSSLAFHIACVKANIAFDRPVVSIWFHVCNTSPSLPSQRYIKYCKQELANFAHARSEEALEAYIVPLQPTSFIVGLLLSWWPEAANLNYHLSPLRPAACKPRLKMEKKGCLTFRPSASSSLRKSNTAACSCPVKWHSKLAEDCFALK